MLDYNYIPDQVLTDLLDAKDLPDSSSGNTEIAKLSTYEAFDTWCRYNGFIGYTSLIMEALDGIRLAEEKHKEVSNDDHTT